MGDSQIVKFMKFSHYTVSQYCEIIYENLFPLCGTTEAAAKRSNSEGITELIRALDRRGPRGLDALVEALEEEEGANADLIKIIRTGEQL